jgi:hypothetical protein
MRLRAPGAFDPWKESIRLTSQSPTKARGLLSGTHGEAHKPLSSLTRASLRGGANDQVLAEQVC